MISKQTLCKSVWYTLCKSLLCKSNDVQLCAKHIMKQWTLTWVGHFQNHETAHEMDWNHIWLSKDQIIYESIQSTSIFKYWRWEIPMSNCIFLKLNKYRDRKVEICPSSIFCKMYKYENLWERRMQQQFKIWLPQRSDVPSVSHRMERERNTHQKIYKRTSSSTIKT